MVMGKGWAIVLTGLALVAGPAAAQGANSSPVAAAQHCASLAGFTLPGSTLLITKAEPFRPPPPWNRNRPFQPSGRARAKSIS